MGRVESPSLHPGQAQLRLIRILGMCRGHACECSLTSLTSKYVASLYSTTTVSWLAESRSQDLRLLSCLAARAPPDVNPEVRGSAQVSGDSLQYKPVAPDLEFYTGAKAMHQQVTFNSHPHLFTYSPHLTSTSHCITISSRVYTLEPILAGHLGGHSHTWGKERGNITDRWVKNVGTKSRLSRHQPTAGSKIRARPGRAQLGKVL